MNGDGDEPVKEEVTAESENTETPTAEKGKKRKFGETGLTAEDMKPWVIR